MKTKRLKIKSSLFFRWKHLLGVVFLAGQAVFAGPPSPTVDEFKRIITQRMIDAGMTMDQTGSQCLSPDAVQGVNDFLSGIKIMGSKNSRGEARIVLDLSHLDPHLHVAWIPVRSDGSLRWEDNSHGVFFPGSDKELHRLGLSAPVGAYQEVAPTHIPGPGRRTLPAGHIWIDTSKPNSGNCTGPRGVPYGPYGGAVAGGAAAGLIGAVAQDYGVPGYVLGGLGTAPLVVSAGVALRNPSALNPAQLANLRGGVAGIAGGIASGYVAHEAGLTPNQSEIVSAYCGWGASFAGGPVVGVYSGASMVGSYAAELGYRGLQLGYQGFRSWDIDAQLEEQRRRISSDLGE